MNENLVTFFSMQKNKCLQFLAEEKVRIDAWDLTSKFFLCVNKGVESYMSVDEIFTVIRSSD